MNIYENGSKVISTYSFTASGIQQLYSAINDIPRYIAQMSFWDYQFSDTQSLKLTS